QNQPHTRLHGALQPEGPVSRLRDRVARHLERVHHSAADGGLVFHDHDLRIQHGSASPELATGDASTMRGTPHASSMRRQSFICAQSGILIPFSAPSSRIIFFRAASSSFSEALAFFFISSARYFARLALTSPISF